MSSGRASYVAFQDVLFLSLLPVLAAVGWLLPERAWRPVCGWLGLVSFLTPRGWRRAELIGAVLGRQARASARTIERRLSGRVLEARVGILREYRPGGWQPRMELTGGEHIDDALRAGRGVILWISEFAHSDLVAKKALAGAGYELSHLSRSSHGPSGTPFGIRFLNPIQINAEVRYLRERLVMEGDSPVKGLRTLKRRLAENRIVSITVGRQTQAPVAMPFLEGVLELSSGPLKIARAAGAPLLPVFTLPSPNGGFEIRITPPLVLADGGGQPLPDERVFEQYIGRLQPLVLAEPADWRGWRAVRRRLASEPATTTAPSASAAGP